MKYARLLSRLYNTPLAISQAKLDVITSQVTLKLLAGEDVGSLRADSPFIQDHTDISGNDTPKTKVATIKVFDSLVAKNGSGDSGVTSYESINRQIQSVVADGANKIVFYIDSPGGEVAGLFGLAKTINSLSKDLGIETVAVSDGMITSAAYVIAAACDKVLATSSTIVGSIGVIMTLINTSAADKRQGYKYEIIRSKDEKALLNPHEPFSSKGLEDAVKMLGTLDTIMNETVNSFRPKLSIDQIITLNGNTVLGEEALQLGLIDGVVDSYSAAMDEVTSTKVQSKTSKSSLTTNGANMSTQTLEEALAENIKLSSELEASKQKVALGIAQGKADEQARILGILEASDTFKLPLATAVKRIKAGTSIADTVEMFESIKEAIQMANPVGSESLSGTVQYSLNGQGQESELDMLIGKFDSLGKNSDAQDDFSASLNLLNIIK